MNNVKWNLRKVFGLILKRSASIKKQGYLLLEVLLSLAILATALLAVIHSFAASLEAGSLIGTHTQLILTTQRLLAEARNLPKLSEGVTSGVLKQEGKTFYWKRAISRDKEITGLFNVKVTVAVDSHNRKKDFTLETKFYNGG